VEDDQRVFQPLPLSRLICICLYLPINSLTHLYLIIFRCHCHLESLTQFFLAFFMSGSATASADRSSKPSSLLFCGLWVPCAYSFLIVLLIIYLTGSSLALGTGLTSSGIDPLFWPSILSLPTIFSVVNTFYLLTSVCTCL
jgi:hypothetical protein